ncbi:uncharacterized protein LOC131943160 [Physella acuta]|uniref:uncharacterized protein LOC131943160 n=1 Tax=Physella acuta TaxID=109671 RepID=UPI0027DDD2CD|nr:uncharacterized protein LOC131943160 [Physella acuta]
MEFSKFRQSGDLSDIIVLVDSQEHKLHRFPLFARSDYFCELARSKTGSNDPPKIDLKDFPGGNAIFKLVADFCYNMPVKVTTTNAVEVRCAAEYLKMLGGGNLSEVADKYLKDALTSARLNRSTMTVLTLLAHCNNAGELAKTTGLVDNCVDAFAECWAKATSHVSIGKGAAFTKVSSSNEVKSAFKRVQDSGLLHNSDKLDEVSVKHLIALRYDWFAAILSKARAQGVSWSELGTITVHFISAILLMDAQKETEEANQNSTKGEKEDKDAETSKAGTDGKKTTKKISKKKEMDEEEKLWQGLSEYNKKCKVGEILDAVVLVLPEQAFTVPLVTIDWLTKVLRVATVHKCACKDVLVRVAADLMSRLEAEDLSTVSPSVLHDVLVSTSTEPGAKSPQAERASRLVDTYMEQMATKGILTAETFRLLASATNKSTRTSHDSLYEVLEFVLKSEKDKLTKEQKDELTALVNFELLNETSLQKALDNEVTPAAVVARSAIKLCSRLRSELASVKYNTQGDEFQKYNGDLAGSGRTGIEIHPPVMVQPKHFTSFSSRNLDSGFTETSDSHRGRSPLEPLRLEDETSSDDHASDPVKAAQSILMAARQRLALPVYTGHRLSRLSPPSSGGHVYRHALHRGLVEEDTGLEEDLDYKYDRPFRSLDPRVRYHRIWLQALNGQRSGTYFPYTSYHRF